MRPPGTHVAFYLRTSTAKRVATADGEDYRQRPEIQEERLRRLCDQRGWEVVAVYADRASGRKEQRPELQRLMADARRGEFDVVAVAAFDRFARSVRHLVLALDEFRQLGIEFVSLREAIDTSTPMGRAMFTVIAAMAELESSLISERTAAAMEYARTHGTRSGKTIGRQRRVFRRDEARELRQRGVSYRAIARQLGVPVSTVHDALRQTDLPRSERGLGGKGSRGGKHKPGAAVSSVRQGDLYRTDLERAKTIPEGREGPRATGDEEQSLADVGTPGKGGGMSERQQDRQVPIAVLPETSGPANLNGGEDGSTGGYQDRTFATGKHPGGRPRRQVDLAQVRAHLANGLSLRQTARKLHVGYGTLHRAVREAGGTVAVIQNSTRGIL